VLYGISAGRAFALDAASGAELWTFAPGDAVSGTLAPARGLVYWSDGKGDERILFGRGHRLFALDARSGRMIGSFGDSGSVDLRDGLPKTTRDSSSPPRLARSIAIS
jgi:quinoprotein glucose dehydrogenase